METNDNSNIIQDAEHASDIASDSKIGKNKKKKSGIAGTILIIILLCVAAFGGYELLIVKPHKEAQASFDQEVQTYNGYYEKYNTSITEFNKKVDQYRESVEGLDAAIDETEAVIKSGTPYDSSLIDSAQADISKIKSKIETVPEKIQAEPEQNFSGEGLSTQDLNSTVDSIRNSEAELQNKITDIEDQTKNLTIPDYTSDIEKLEKHQKEIKDSIDLYKKMLPDNDNDSKTIEEDEKENDDDTDVNPAYYNAFDNLKISFTGIAPGGEAKLKKKTTNGIDGTYNFHIDKNSNLSNGDQVTVTIEYKGKFPTDHKTIEQLNQDLIKTYGKVLYPAKKTFTVSGLKYYLTDVSQIDPDTLSSMEKYANDALKDDFSKRFGDDVALKGADYIGNYFLLGKEFNDGVFSDNYNKLYLLFKVSCEITLGDKADYSNNLNYIYAIEYDDLVNLADNTNGTDLSDFNYKLGDFTIDTGVKQNFVLNYKFQFFGFKDINAAYNKIIAKQSDKYSYVNNVSEAQ